MPRTALPPPADLNGGKTPAGLPCGRPPPLPAVPQVATLVPGPSGGASTSSSTHAAAAEVTCITRAPGESAQIAAGYADGSVGGRLGSSLRAWCARELLGPARTQTPATLLRYADRSGLRLPGPIHGQASLLSSTKSLLCPTHCLCIGLRLPGVALRGQASHLQPMPQQIPGPPIQLVHPHQLGTDSTGAAKACFTLLAHPAARCAVNASPRGLTHSQRLLCTSRAADPHVGLGLA